jgi:hypothetical protein
VSRLFLAFNRAFRRLFRSISSSFVSLTGASGPSASANVIVLLLAGLAESGDRKPRIGTGMRTRIMRTRRANIILDREVRVSPLDRVNVRCDGVVLRLLDVSAVSF